MVKRMAAALVGLTLAAGPLAAQTVLLQDNFNSENGGATQLNYNSFANWTVINTVDLIGNSNGFGITCQSGACVDLAGSTSAAAGGLTTKLAYSFNAGDVMRMQMRVRGNQRALGNSDVLRIGANFTGSPNLTGVTVERNGISTNLADRNGASIVFSDYNFLGSDPYVTVAFQFTAQSAGTARFQIAAFSVNRNIGPILDDVEITRTSAVVPEPATALLVITGFVGLLGTRKRRVISA